MSALEQFAVFDSLNEHKNQLKIETFKKYRLLNIISMTVISILILILIVMSICQYQFERGLAEKMEQNEENHMEDISKLNQTSQVTKTKY